MKKLFSVLVVALFVFGLASCEQLETTGIGFKIETLTLELDETFTLDFINVNDVALTELTLTSEDGNIVTVVDRNTIEAVGVGVTAVTLSYEGVIVDYVLVYIFDPNGGSTVGTGTDGREVEFQTTTDYIQWRYVGETSWTNLIELTTLIGENGSDGSEVEFQTTATHIQWRYVGETTWVNLLDLTTLPGGNGTDGVDGEDGVSVVDVYFVMNDSDVTYDNVYSLNTGDLDSSLVLSAGMSNIYIELEGNHPEQGRNYDIDFAVTNYNTYAPDYEGGENDQIMIDNTEFDEFGNIIEQVLYTDDDVTIYYSGFGTESLQNNGYEYIRVEGTLAYDLTIDVVYNEDEDDGVNVDFEYRVLSNFDWSEPIPFDPNGNATFLVFELSNEETITINYTEILNNSSNNAGLEFEFISYVNFVTNSVDLVYSALMNSPYNSPGSEGLFLDASALNYSDNQYTFEDFIEIYVDMMGPGPGIGYNGNPAVVEGELYLSRDELMYIALNAGVCFASETEFMDDSMSNPFAGGCDNEDGPTIIDVLSILLGVTYSTDYLGNDSYSISPSLMYEYLLMLETFDESLYYQYLMDNPLTGWNLYDVSDRLEFNRALANNALSVSIVLDLSTAELLNDAWMNGGDEGFFYDDYQSLEVGIGGVYSYLNTSAYFSTPSVNNFYNRIASNQDYVTFTIPYGAAFPLPNADAFNLTIDGKTYILEGYEYANFYMEGFDPVLTHGEIDPEDSDQNYVTFGSSYEEVGFGPDFATYYLFGEYLESGDLFATINSLTANRYMDGAGLPFLFISPILTEVFTVTFNNTDESIYETIDNVKSGDTVTLPSTPNVPTGYTFVGWEDLEGSPYTSSTPVTSNITLNPIFEAIDYTVTFNANGASIEDDPLDIPLDYDEDFTVPTSTYTYEGYDFVKWNTQADGEGISYNEGDTASNLTTTDGDTVTLYAIWNEVPMTVTYDEGDFTGTHSNETDFVVNDLPYTLLDASVEGYTFVGWAFGNGSPDVTEITDFVENLVLYAVFEANTYTVRFDANGGSGTAIADVNATYDDDFTTASNTYIFTGYEFVEWNTQADGEGISYNEGDTASNLTTTDGDTVTLYAIWNEVEMTVTYEFNGVSGTNLNNSTLYVSNLPYPLTDSSADGYDFIGWFDASTGGNEVTSINDFGNVTIYARFSSNAVYVPSYQVLQIDGGFTVYSNTVSTDFTVDALETAFDNVVTNSEGTPATIVDFLTNTGQIDVTIEYYNALDDVIENNFFYINNVTMLDFEDILDELLLSNAPGATYVLILIQVYSS